MMNEWKNGSAIAAVRRSEKDSPHEISLNAKSGLMLEQSFHMLENSEG